MKIINYGEHYEIYADDLKTYDKLPALTYKVNFHPLQGFSLVKTDDFKTIEEKIYGNHLNKIEKVFKSYKDFNRSLGIILSGDKGIGKSLFVQLLAEESIKNGIPVVVVNKNFKGIADFIDKIDQEVLIIFDEFEKVFHVAKSKDNEGESQEDMLGLFDGTSQKKRIYAITVNNLHKVSEFILSRTGRFHYHIRFEYPNAQETEEYLKDKIDEEYYKEIKNVISFTNRVKLNYDSLRSIAFELNQGYTFNDAIADLNILSTDRQQYNIVVEFDNGRTETLDARNLNLFSNNIKLEEWIDGADVYATITFNPSNINIHQNEMIVHGDDVTLELSDLEDSKYYTKDTKVTKLKITQHKGNYVNYKLTV